MAVAEKVPSILKGLSPRQLAVLQVMLKHDLKLNISESSSYRYSGRQKPQNVGISWPENISPDERNLILNEWRIALGKSTWSGGVQHAGNQVGTALLKKGVFVEVAEVEPARKTEGAYGREYMHGRVARYALGNAVREAVGGIAVALDEVRAREAAAVAREKAWSEAVAPLAKEYRLIQQRRSDIRYNLSKHLDDPTPDALVDGYNRHQQVLAEHNELNARLKVISDIHNREYKPFAW